METKMVSSHSGASKLKNRLPVATNLDVVYVIVLFFLLRKKMYVFIEYQLNLILYLLKQQIIAAMQRLSNSEFKLKN